MRMIKKMLPPAALAVALFAGLPTSMFAIAVSATTNVFVAGQDSTGINTMGGLFPGVAQTFVAGVGQTVTFGVTPSALSCGTGACASAGTGDGAALSFPFGSQTGT